MCATVRAAAKVLSPSPSISRAAAVICSWMPSLAGAAASAPAAAPLCCALAPLRRVGGEDLVGTGLLLGRLALVLLLVMAVLPILPAALPILPVALPVLIVGGAPVAAPSSAPAVAALRRVAAWLGRAGEEDSAGGSLVLGRLTLVPLRGTAAPPVLPVSLRRSGVVHRLFASALSVEAAVAVS